MASFSFLPLVSFTLRTQVKKKQISAFSFVLFLGFEKRTTNTMGIFAFIYVPVHNCCLYRICIFKQIWLCGVSLHPIQLNPVVLDSFMGVHVCVV